VAAVNPTGLSARGIRQTEMSMVGWWLADSARLLSVASGTRTTTVLGAVVPELLLW